MSNFDDVLRHLGEFGRYQKCVYVLLCLPGIVHGFRMLIYVYLLNVPGHRCAIPGYPNDTYAVQSHHHAVLINRTIPYVDKDGHFVYDQCHIYSSPNISKRNRTIVACDKWVYDKSVFQSTAATDMNMVCSNSLEAANAQMIFMAGYLVGAFLFGAIGDRFGRRIAFFSSILILVAGGFGLNWTPNYIVFVIIRFINGATTAGMFTTCFVLGMEMVGPSKRVWAGIVGGFFYSSGYLILNGVAFLVRDWHKLELIMAAPVGVFLIYWWILPESPRWLISRHRYSEARRIILRAADCNKVTIPKEDLEFHDEGLQHKKQSSVLQLFTSCTLVFRTAIIFFSWMVVSLAYFGLSANADNLGVGGIHLNSLLAGLVEFPASILCLLLLDRIGRKALFCVFMLLGGIACILTVFTIMYADESVQWLTIVLSMIGKLGASGAFSVVYVYSSEIFPTVVRNSALGLSSSMARIGGMIAPYFLDLGNIVEGKFGQALPMLLFGILAVISGLLGLTLPETLNRDLPETIEDAKNYSRKAVVKASEELDGGYSGDESDFEDSTRSLLH